MTVSERIELERLVNHFAPLIIGKNIVELQPYFDSPEAQRMMQLNAMDDSVGHCRGMRLWFK